MKMQFGITLNTKGKFGQYTYSELAHFVECTYDSVKPDELAEQYRDLLKAIMAGKVKKNTLVPYDLLSLLCDDLYNRASIDYLEGNYNEEDEPEIVKGGFHFLKKAGELRNHLVDAPVVYTEEDFAECASN